MSRTSRRWLPSAVAAIVLVTIGFGAGRAVSPETPNPERAGAPPPARSVVEPPTGTACTATAKEPVDRRTPEGAVTAVTAYGLAFDGPGVLDPDWRRELIREVAAQQARDDLEEALAGAAGLLTSRLGLSADVLSDDTFVWRVVPAGWQLRSYDADRAVVAVWATGIAMAGGRPLARPGWRTTEVELVWQRGAWRLVAFRTEPGPEPPTAGDETAGKTAARAMNRFEPFTYQPAGGDPR